MINESQTKRISNYERHKKRNTHKKDKTKQVYLFSYIKI